MNFSIFSHRILSAHAAFAKGALSHRSVKIALIVWLGYALILATVVAIAPDKRTVTPNYRQAALKWWRVEETIYTGKRTGFLYFPHSAILYSPFALLPKRIGEPLWRLVSLGIFAWALWRAASLLQKLSPNSHPFALLTALTIPSSFASAGNGQMNLLLSALLLHATVDLSAERKWRPAAVLLVATAFKPLAIVLILLACAVFPRLILPVSVFAIVFAAAPFLHPNPSYVLKQHRICLQVLLASSQYPAHEFCDIAGLFRTFGFHQPPSFWFPLRALAAIATLALAFFASRRHASPIREFLVLALATTYLMLFNPRTEANSYVLLSPSAAWLTALVTLIALPKLESSSPPGSPLILTIFLLALGVDSYGPLHNWTNLWLKALLTCCYATWLAIVCFQPKKLFLEK